MNRQEHPEINAIILMGVSGCGKTTIGHMLASRLEWEFFESDEYHSSEDVHKMSTGIPLTDEDRWPWLVRLHQVLNEHFQLKQPLVLACSALKESYRDILTGEMPGIVYIYMKGDFEIIQKRMKARENHYMKADMLQSQFDALEEPTDALIVDILCHPEEIISQILSYLDLA